MTIFYLDRDGVDELVAKVKQLVSSGGIILDNTPTQDSTNGVTSGGVYTALTGKADSAHVHAAGDIQSGTFDDARIPSLAASKIGSGTLAVARGGTGASTATQNQVFAAPYGQNGAPTFRALHSSDIPSLSPTKSGFQGGTIAISSINANSGADSAITFTPAFSSAPIVIVGMTSSQTALTGACSAYAMNVSTTGFTLRRQNNSTSARNLGAYWMAFEI